MIRTNISTQKKILTEIKVAFNLGNSSSAISAGNLKINFPRAINPNATVADLTSASDISGHVSAWKAFKHPWKVVRPYTGSFLLVKASRKVLVASRTYNTISLIRK
jgi:hypothetical protein